MSAEEKSRLDNAQEEDQPLDPAEEAARAKRVKKLTRILVVFLLLDAAAASMLYSGFRKNQEDIQTVHSAQSQKVSVSQEMTEEELNERLAIALGEASSLISLRSEMHAENGIADVFLANRAESSCAVEMELMLAQSRRIILRTGVIEPGWYLEAAELTAPLEPGEYQCLARCLFYTMDDNAYLGTTARQVLLTVR